MKKIALDIARPNSVMLMARIADAMVDQMQAGPDPRLVQCFAETEEVTVPAQPDNRTRQQRRRDEREARKPRPPTPRPAIPRGDW